MLASVPKPPAVPVQDQLLQRRHAAGAVCCHTSSPSPSRVSAFVTVVSGSPFSLVTFVGPPVPLDSRWTWMVAAE